MSEIDYKALLEKYMNYVSGCEGTDFVTGRDYKDSWAFGAIEKQFTPEEWAVLKAPRHGRP